MFATESYIVSDTQALQIKKMGPDEGEQLRNAEHVNLKAHGPLDIQLEDKEKKISAG
jgi:centriolin